MILGIDTMDPTLQGIFFLVATILFIIAGVLAFKAALWHALVAFGLAAFSLVFCYNAFALS